MLRTLGRVEHLTPAGSGTLKNDFPTSGCLGADFRFGFLPPLHNASALQWWLALGKTSTQASGPSPPRPALAFCQQEVRPQPGSLSGSPEGSHGPTPPTPNTHTHIPSATISQRPGGFLSWRWSQKVPVSTVILGGNTFVDFS